MGGSGKADESGARRIFFERVERVDWTKELRGLSGSVDEVEDTDGEILPIRTNSSYAKSTTLLPAPIGTGRRVPTTAPLNLGRRDGGRDRGQAPSMGTGQPAAALILPQTAAPTTGSNVVVPPRRTASLRPLPISTPSAALQSRRLAATQSQAPAQLHQPRPPSRASFPAGHHRSFG